MIGLRQATTQVIQRDVNSTSHTSDDKTSFGAPTTLPVAHTAHQTPPEKEKSQVEELNPDFSRR